MEKTQSLKSALLERGVNIQTIYEEIVKLATDCNELTIHIVLSSILSLSKMFNEILIETSISLTSEILSIFGNFYNDPLISGYILDLIVLMLSDENAGKSFLPIFVPNMRLVIGELASDRLDSNRSLTYMEEEVRINFLVSLIDILILSLRKSRALGYSPDTLFLPFEDMIQIVAKSTTP